jgi:hypothetical protein
LTWLDDHFLVDSPSNIINGASTRTSLDLLIWLIFPMGSPPFAKKRFREVKVIGHGIPWDYLIGEL